jgi:hypothetical protein
MFRVDTTKVSERDILAGTGAAPAEPEPEPEPATT